MEKKIEELEKRIEFLEKQAAAGTATSHDFDLKVDGKRLAQVIVHGNSRTTVTADGIQTTVERP